MRRRTLMRDTTHPGRAQDERKALPQGLSQWYQRGGVHSVRATDYPPGSDKMPSSVPPWRVKRGRQRDRDVLGFRCARRSPTLPVGESSQAMNDPVKTLHQRLGGASFL